VAKWKVQLRTGECQPLSQPHSAHNAWVGGPEAHHGWLRWLGIILNVRTLLGRNSPGTVFYANSRSKNRANQPTMTAFLADGDPPSDRTTMVLTPHMEGHPSGRFADHSRVDQTLVPIQTLHGTQPAVENSVAAVFSTPIADRSNHPTHHEHQRPSSISSVVLPFTIDPEFIHDFNAFYDDFIRSSTYARAISEHNRSSHIDDDDDDDDDDNSLMNDNDATPTTSTQRLCRVLRELEKVNRHISNILEEPYPPSLHPSPRQPPIPRHDRASPIGRKPAVPQTVLGTSTLLRTAAGQSASTATSTRPWCVPSAATGNPDRLHRLRQRTVPPESAPPTYTDPNSERCRVATATSTRPYCCPPTATGNPDRLQRWSLPSEPAPPICTSPNSELGQTSGPTPCYTDGRSGLYWQHPRTPASTAHEICPI